MSMALSSGLSISPHSPSNQLAPEMTGIMSPGIMSNHFMADRIFHDHSAGPGCSQDSVPAEVPVDSTPPSASRSTGKAGSGPKTGSNARDPDRPRRRKARRACLACQRAHLTCGDERPCNRCTKRGIGESCHDGIRKKAKYLHDTPAEALFPGCGPPGVMTYQTVGPYGDGGGMVGPSSQPMGQAVGHPMSMPMVSMQQQQQQQQQQQHFFPTPQMAGFTQYQNGIGSIDGQMTNGSAFSPSFSPPFSPQYQNPSLGRSSMSGPDLGVGVDMGPGVGPGFVGQDPNPFALINAQFSSHFGALEFGALDQLSIIGLDQGIDLDPTDGQFGAANGIIGSVGTSFPGQDPMCHGAFVDWTGTGGGVTVPPIESASQMFVPNVSDDQRHGQLRCHHLQVDTNNSMNVPAMPVATTQSDPVSTPLTDTQPGVMPSMSSSGSMESTTSASSKAPLSPAESPTPQRSRTGRRRPLSQSLLQPMANLFLFSPSTEEQSPQKMRRLADCYDVSQPYPYTVSFHHLQSKLRCALPPDLIGRVSRALSAIRPSFIACTARQSREDLVHAEKTFQRWLLEFENYIYQNGTPTVVLRRTGEVVAASDEFCALTGWDRNDLVGTDPNDENGGAGRDDVDVGGDGNTMPDLASASASNSAAAGTGTTGTYPTRIPASIVELLDPESVVQFFDDFSRLAFSASHDWVTRRGRLLRRRTGATVTDPSGPLSNSSSPSPTPSPSSSSSSHSSDPSPSPPSGADGKVAMETTTVTTTAAEAEMASSLPVDDPVEPLDCMFCWHTKSDMFGMPALLVMNFVPVRGGMVL